MTFEEIVERGKIKLASAGLTESSLTETGELGSSVPGIGSVGSGVTFKRNRKALSQYSICTEIIGENFVPNTSARIFNQELASPILSAPMSGIKTNLKGLAKEEKLLSDILKGCRDGGTLGMCGDSWDTSALYRVPEMIKKYGGIAVIKPRSSVKIEEKINKLISSGVTAIGIDLDGMSGMLLDSGLAGRKTKAELSHIRKMHKGPMFIKGIMSHSDAEAAVNCGFDGIVISNHGGRSIDYLPAVADVLPAIARDFKSRIQLLVDGGVRSGYDVFLYLALGADAVLIGRTMMYAAMGAGHEGVQIAIAKMTSDLERAMLFTNSHEIKNINPSLLKKYG